MQILTAMPNIALNQAINKGSSTSFQQTRIYESSVVDQTADVKILTAIKEELYVRVQDHVHKMVQDHVQNHLQDQI